MQVKKSKATQPSQGPTKSVSEANLSMSPQKGGKSP